MFPEKRLWPLEAKAIHAKAVPKVQPNRPLNNLILPPNCRSKYAEHLMTS